MTWIFDIKDKSGRKIHLSDERWKHIATEHTALANKIEDIKEILLNPLIIGRSKYDENVRYYQKYYKKLSKYLLVSVKCRKFLLSINFAKISEHAQKPLID